MPPNTARKSSWCAAITRSSSRKQFEVKLASANQLYREVEEMRNLLSDQAVTMEEQALEDIPQLIKL